MTRSTTVALAALLALGAQAGPLQVTVVDKEGKPVQDAVVVLVPSAGGAPKSALPMRVTINQQNMRFVPAIAVVGVGAKGSFINNDPWAHHVKASPAGALEFDSTRGGFEFLLDGKPEGKAAKTAEASFDKAGAVLLGCHLHASMRGHVYVSDSPWASLTGADGVSSFEGVPNGPVFVRVWQSDQLLPVPPQQLVLTDAPARANMHLTVVPRRRRT